MSKKPFKKELISDFARTSLGKVCLANNHSIYDVCDMFETKSLITVVRYFTKPSLLTFGQLKMLAFALNRKLENIINIANETPIDSPQYFDEMGDTEEEKKIFERIEALKNKKVKPKIAGWALDGEELIEKEGESLDVDTETVIPYICGKNPYKGKLLEIIEYRREYAEQNPNKNVPLKFSSYCNNCNSPIYFTLKRCFGCRFFELQWGKEDRRKKKPPSPNLLKQYLSETNFSR